MSFLTRANVPTNKIRVFIHDQYAVNELNSVELGFFSTLIYGNIWMIFLLLLLNGGDHLTTSG